MARIATKQARGQLGGFLPSGSGTSKHARSITPATKSNKVLEAANKKTLRKGKHASGPANVQKPSTAPSAAASNVPSRKRRKGAPAAKHGRGMVKGQVLDGTAVGSTDMEVDIQTAPSHESFDTMMEIDQTSVLAPCNGVGSVDLPNPSLVTQTSSSNSNNTTQAAMKPHESVVTVNNNNIPPSGSSAVTNYVANNETQAQALPEQALNSMGNVNIPPTKPPVIITSTACASSNSTQVRVVPQAPAHTSSTAACNVRTLVGQPSIGSMTCQVAEPVMTMMQTRVHAQKRAKTISINQQVSGEPQPVLHVAQPGAQASKTAVYIAQQATPPVVTAAQAPEPVDLTALGLVMRYLGKQDQMNTLATCKVIAKATMNLNRVKFTVSSATRCAGFGQVMTWAPCVHLVLCKQTARPDDLLVLDGALHAILQSNTVPAFAFTGVHTISINDVELLPTLKFWVCTCPNFKTLDLSSIEIKSTDYNDVVTVYHSLEHMILGKVEAVKGSKVNPHLRCALKTLTFKCENVPYIMLGSMVLKGLETNIRVESPTGKVCISLPEAIPSWHVADLKTINNVTRTLSNNRIQLVAAPGMSLEWQQCQYHALRSQQRLSYLQAALPGVKPHTDVVLNPDMASDYTMNAIMIWAGQDAESVYLKQNYQATYAADPRFWDVMQMMPHLKNVFFTYRHQPGNSMWQTMSDHATPFCHVAQNQLAGRPINYQLGTFP